MASKERIQRMKEETRTNILVAALKIVKEEGWQALSLRKIADAIEYTAPIIYEYFANKEAILLELTRQGYGILYRQIAEAQNGQDSPADQLEAMWMAYWNFAFEEKEYYQVLYGVEMNCCLKQQQTEEAESLYAIFGRTINELRKDQTMSEEETCRWYYTYWSVVHGLVSINFVRKGTTDEINMQILKSAISGISRTIQENR
jgi:AcrR family transcriptional regulator